MWCLMWSCASCFRFKQTNDMICAWQSLKHIETHPSVLCRCLTASTPLIARWLRTWHALAAAHRNMLLGRLAWFLWCNLCVWPTNISTHGRLTKQSNKHIMSNSFLMATWRREFDTMTISSCTANAHVAKQLLSIKHDYELNVLFTIHSF